MPFRTPKRLVLESKTTSANNALAHRQLRKCRRTPSLSQWLTLSAATTHAAGSFQKTFANQAKSPPKLLPATSRGMPSRPSPRRKEGRGGLRDERQRGNKPEADPEGRQDSIPGRNLNEPANKRNSRHVSPPSTHSPAPSRQAVAAAKQARPDATQSARPPPHSPHRAKPPQTAHSAPGAARAQKERVPTTCAASDWHSQPVRFKMGLNQRPPD